MRCRAWLKRKQSDNQEREAIREHDRDDETHREIARSQVSRKARLLGLRVNRMSNPSGHATSGPTAQK